MSVPDKVYSFPGVTVRVPQRNRQASGASFKPRNPSFQTTGLIGLITIPRDKAARLLMRIRQTLAQLETSRE